MHARALFLTLIGALSTALVVGCGDDNTTDDPDISTDSGTDASTDAYVDTASNDVLDAIDDVGVRCEPGATAERTIGSDGGALDFCGASLVVPAGAVAADTRFWVEFSVDPGAAPPGYVFAGAPFVFSADGPLLADVQLAVPHEPTTRPIELFQRVEQAWWSIEACEVTETTIGQSSALPVEFVAATADRDFPPGPSGLGDGEIDLTFNGASSTVVLDDSDYAFHIDDLSGNRSIDVNILNSLDEGVAWSFRLQMVAGSDDSGLLSVQIGDTGETGLYNYLQPVHGPATAFEIIRDGDRVTGSGDVKVFQGEGSGELSFAFDLGTEAYRFPPELVCPGGEGGDPGP